MHAFRDKMIADETNMYIFRGKRIAKSDQNVRISEKNAASESDLHSFAQLVFD